MFEKYSQSQYVDYPLFGTINSTSLRPTLLEIPLILNFDFDGDEFIFTSWGKDKKPVNFDEISFRELEVLAADSENEVATSLSNYFTVGDQMILTITDYPLANAPKGTVLVSSSRDWCFHLPDGVLQHEIKCHTNDLESLIQDIVSGPPIIPNSGFFSTGRKFSDSNIHIKLSCFFRIAGVALSISSCSQAIIESSVFSECIHDSSLVEFLDTEQVDVIGCCITKCSNQWNGPGNILILDHGCSDIFVSRTEVQRCSSQMFCNVIDSILSYSELNISINEGFICCMGISTSDLNQKYGIIALNKFDTNPSHPNVETIGSILQSSYSTINMEYCSIINNKLNTNTVIFSSLFESSSRFEGCEIVDSTNYSEGFVFYAGSISVSFYCTKCIINTQRPLTNSESQLFIN